MIAKQPRQLAAYTLVSVLSVSGAFLVSLHFLKRAKAQAPPPPATEAPPQPGSGDAPPTAGQPTEPPPEEAAPAPAPPSSDAAAAAPTKPAAAAAVPTAQAPQAPAPAPQGQPPAPAPGSAPSAAAAALPGAVPQAGINELEGFLEPFIYDLVNRRDPFQPYAEYVPSTAPDDSGPPRALSPAQRWDLEQLKLIGIMWDIKDPKAMFLDPEEDVMILGRDESIGNRNGYVATIREGEVVVVEAIRKRGDIIYRTRVLRIER